MGRKILIVAGVVLLIFTFQSCKSKPEEALLKRYFHALALNDLTTMSTMALEPVALDAANWKILRVGEEKVSPAFLPELDQRERELKKKLEENVGPVLDAKDFLDMAKDDLDAARTAAAKAAARKKVEELQAVYDEKYEHHKQLQKEYNVAKAAAAREEEVSSFSISARDIYNLRELTGTANTKEVEVEIENKAGAKRRYLFYLRKNDLKDESINVSYRGRWIIVKFEPIT